MRELRKNFCAFWSKNPALFLGFALLLGCALAFKPHGLLGIAFATLALTAKSKKAFFTALFIFTAGFFLSTVRHPDIRLPHAKIQGKGIFHVDVVKYTTSPFNRSLLYRGTLKSFEDEEGHVFKDLTCSIYLPTAGKRPLANTDYCIHGTLSQKGSHFFVLKPQKNVPWTPVASFFNFAEWRFAAKQAVFRMLKKQIADPHSRTFLSALATGEVDERILSMEFGKVGLQHILAISGFHFALVALFLSVLFRLFLPDKMNAILLIAALTFYYFFLGNAPSIQRAYIAIVLFVFGRLLSRRITAMNALGIGLIVELLFRPITVTELSFQLTFLCTLSILLFYPILHRCVATLLPVRTPQEVAAMTLFNKHGYILSALLRKTLSVNLAVHIISIPVLLHLFHKFPLLSIAYNLFFPACVCVSMLLLFIPFCSCINNIWTSKILTFTTNAPAFLDFCLRSQYISFSIVVSFLTISLLFGIAFHEKVEKNKA